MSLLYVYLGFDFFKYIFYLLVEFVFFFGYCMLFCRNVLILFMNEENILVLLLIVDLDFFVYLSKYGL